MKDSKPDFAKKLLYIVLCVIAIAYNISPIDLLSDLMPVVGSLDDVVATLVPLIWGYKNIGGKNL